MSLPRYPEYKDSGIDWLEEVPIHWQSSKLKHVCSFTTGWTPPTGDSSAYEGSNLWANISDLGERIVSDTAKRISDEAVAKANICISPEGSLLFSFKLSVGQVSIAGCDMYTNEAIATFKESGLLLTGYAYYALPVFVVRNASENIYGAKLLNQELISSAKVAAPPVNEQRDLMAFLDRETAKIDALIAEQEKLLALLAEKRQATISHAVTRGLDPNVPMKDSGIPWLGEVPAHWEVRRLKTLSPAITVGIVVNPSDYVSSTGLPFIYGGDIGEGHISIESCRRIDPEDSERQAKTRLQAGDLLTVRVGAPGVTAVVPEECEGGNCASVMLVRRGDFDSDWLCFAMNSRYVRYQVEVVQYGAAQEQFNISHAINFWIATPPQDEQRRLAIRLKAAITCIDNLRASATRAIDLLRERRGALIAAAVTGKVDLRDLAHVN